MLFDSSQNGASYFHIVNIGQVGLQLVMFVTLVVVITPFAQSPPTCHMLIVHTPIAGSTKVVLVSDSHIFTISPFFALDPHQSS
jgi:hypothetical protein